MSQVSESPADPFRADPLGAHPHGQDGLPRPEVQPPHPPEPVRHGLMRQALGVLVEIVVAIYVVADTAVSLLFRPVFRLLSSLGIVQRLERGIQAMHPYTILVVMVVPFAIAEVAKVFAVYWMAEGHMRSGMTIFIGAYIVSIFVCERILHAGKAKLMTIPWFAWCYNWVLVIKDHVFGWFRRTAVWRAAMAMRDRVRATARRVYARVRAPFENRGRQQAQVRR